MAEIKDFYTENIENLIDDLKVSIPTLRTIISQSIDAEIKDDKLLNVLKAKRQAAEDVEWTLNKVNQLTKQLSGEVEDKNETKNINRAKEFAQKNK